MVAVVEVNFREFFFSEPVANTHPCAQRQCQRVIGVAHSNQKHPNTGGGAPRKDLLHLATPSHALTYDHFVFFKMFIDVGTISSVYKNTAAYLYT